MARTEELAEDLMAMVDTAIEYPGEEDVTVKIDDKRWYTGYQVTRDGVALATGVMSMYQANRSGQILGPDEVFRMAAVDAINPEQDMRFVVGDDHPGKIERVLEVGGKLTHRPLSGEESEGLLEWLSSDLKDRSKIQHLGELSVQERARLHLPKSQQDPVSISKPNARSHSRENRRGWTRMHLLRS